MPYRLVKGPTDAGSAVEVRIEWGVEDIQHGRGDIGQGGAGAGRAGQEVRATCDDETGCLVGGLTAVATLGPVSVVGGDEDGPAFARVSTRTGVNGGDYAADDGVDAGDVRAIFAGCAAVLVTGEIDLAEMGEEEVRRIFDDGRDDAVGGGGVGGALVVVIGGEGVEMTTAARGSPLAVMVAI